MLRTNLSVSFATFGALLIACGSDAGDETSTSSSSGSSSGSLGASSSSSGGASSGSTSSGGTSSSSGSTSSSSGAASSGGASSSGDAGTDTCGARRCAGSETCVDEVCELPACVGVQVPGDYATVQAAVTALAPVGGTICVAPGLYAEDVRLENAHGLIVQGRSAETTKLRSVTGHADATGLTLRGLGMQQASRLSNGAITVEHCSFASATVFPALDAASGAGERLALYVRHSRFVAPTGTALRVLSQFEEITAVLDGIDVSGETALYFAPDGDTGGSILLQNSFVHDSARGFEASMYKGAATVFSSTFVDNGIAIRTEGYPVSSNALVWHNVLVTGSDVAVSLHKAASQSHNALYGNTTNYAEAAVPGDAFVTQDCLLDESTPPRLGPGSPCRAAGTADYATQHDFFGADRGAPPSIGAVD